MVIKKLINIIKGTYYNIFNKHEHQAHKRMIICNKCTHKVNIGKIEICDLCGCILDSKTRVEDEHCEMNKW